MRIACLIDSLGSGGAERQLSELAVGLLDKGHRVALCHYHAQHGANSFYETWLRERGVEIERFCSAGRLDRVWKVRGWLRHFKPDILQAYLPGPNAIAVLAGLGRRCWKVVVSERIALDYQGARRLRLKAIAQLYRGADWVVTNSHANLQVLVDYVPGTQQKSSVIWNCVDLDRFHPRDDTTVCRPFRFLCVASMSSRKNSRRLAEALALLKERSTKPFVLRWVGQYNERLPDQRENMAETARILRRSGLERQFVFAGETETIELEYQNADALVLVSTREGLSNAVCEGLASGLPVVAGKVADLPRIIRDGENGFLCDPLNVQDIARALEQCLNLEPADLSRFGSASRRRAESLFDKRRFIDDYENLYRTLISDGCQLGPVRD